MPAGFAPPGMGNGLDEQDDGSEGSDNESESEYYAHDRYIEIGVQSGEIEGGPEITITRRSITAATTTNDETKDTHIVTDPVANNTAHTAQATITDGTEVPAEPNIHSSS